MEKIDKRKKLEEQPFSYRVTKNETVFVDYFGKQVKILKDKEADQFLKRMDAAENETARQLIMAKVTGNFKRGNERSTKKKY